MCHTGVDTEELGDVLRTAVLVPDMTEVVRDQELEVALAYHLHALHVNDLGGVEGGPHEFPGGGFFSWSLPHPAPWLLKTGQTKDQRSEYLFIMIF